MYVYIYIRFPFLPFLLARCNERDDIYKITAANGIGSFSYARAIIAR